MRVLRVDHIGIAVKNCEEAFSRWRVLLGARMRKKETLEERGVRLVELDVGGETSVELVEPLQENTPVDKFIKEKGEGIHHLSLLVEGLEGGMEELKKQGVEFVTNQPVRGTGGSRIVFIHPRSFGGILLELKEGKK